MIIGELKLTELTLGLSILTAKDGLSTLSVGLLVQKKGNPGLGGVFETHTYDTPEDIIRQFRNAIDDLESKLNQEGRLGQERSGKDVACVGRAPRLAQG
jgi:hypothetical protein